MVNSYSAVIGKPGLLWEGGGGEGYFVDSHLLVLVPLQTLMVKYTSIMPDRKWKHFPGNNCFYCNGLLMTSRQVAILIFVLIMIVVVAGLFFAFE